MCLLNLDDKEYKKRRSHDQKDEASAPRNEEYFIQQLRSRGLDVFRGKFLEFRPREDLERWVQSFNSSTVSKLNEEGISTIIDKDDAFICNHIDIINYQETNDELESDYAVKVIETTQPYFGNDGPLLSNCMYVRCFYEHLLHKILGIYNTDKQDIALIGNPGTGKSVFQSYLIYRMFMDHKKKSLPLSPEIIIRCYPDGAKKELIYTFYIIETGEVFEGINVRFNRIDWKGKSRKILPTI